MNSQPVTLEIPAAFWAVRYNGRQYPGVAVGLADGANCQHFCYEILRHFGFEIGPLRSSELWADETFTHIVTDPAPLDLVLFNSTAAPFGAHVGISLDSHRILHLCQKIGTPVVWEWEEFLRHEEYRVLVGRKRPLRRTASHECA